MHSIRVTPAVVTATLFLTLYHFSAADHHADYCSSLVPTRTLKPGEIVEDEVYYFCHPTTPNAFVTCLVGVAVPRAEENANDLPKNPKIILGKEPKEVTPNTTDVVPEIKDSSAVLNLDGANEAEDVERPVSANLIEGDSEVVEKEPKMSVTVVLEEQEVLCNPGMYFNSLKKACVVHPLSNCAISFAVHPPSHEQQLCEAYRETLSTNHTDVAKLICHDKLKSEFIVCPINTASAVRMKCVNNTFFSQRLQKCVPDEEDSECPIEWKEIARENAPKAEAMTKECPMSRCICNTVLSQCPNEVAYAGHPDDHNKFIVCVRGQNGAPNQVSVGYCPKTLFWSDRSGRCERTHFRKPIPECSHIRTVQPAPLPPRPTTRPTKPIIPPVHPISPVEGGQHGCIDCEITPRQRCECARALQRSGKEAMYICDPEHQDRFLVCHAPNRVICQPCAGGMRWNSDHGACGPIRKCLPWNCLERPSPAPTNPPTLPPTFPPTRPPTFPPTRPPTYPPTYPPTRPPTYPPTRPPTYPPTLPPTYRPTIRPTMPPPPPPFCDYYYEYHPVKLNWYSAMKVCKANQGSLVTIPTLDVQGILRDRFGSTSKKNQVWIGASDRRREGLWEWVTGERFGFTNWYRNQPSYKKNMDCLAFNYYKKGAWAALDCSLNKPFICQNLVCS